MGRIFVLAMALVAPVVLTACESPGADAADGREAPRAESAELACAIETDRVELPAAIRESSGIARAADGSLWTHNDGDEARLYRVGEGGLLEQVVALDGAAAIDIEDIDAGPCPGGTGDCFYVADIGDNSGRRAEVAVLIVPTPPTGVERATATRVPFTYPGGPRDAESLAVLPSGDVLVVSKGRGVPIELFRLPAGSPQGAPAVLERIDELGPAPERNDNFVTGAGASEDGAWVAVRTNEELGIYRTDELLAGGARPALVFDLDPLGEQQGEGVDIANDGRVWLTSEGARGGTPLLARLRCQLPD